MMKVVKTSQQWRKKRMYERGYFDIWHDIWRTWQIWRTPAKVLTKIRMTWQSPLKMANLAILANIGVRAGGARGAAAPPNFGQLRFFGQLEKIWAKPVFKDVSMFFISLKRQIFSILI